jgi:hypothetical protein
MVLKAYQAVTTGIGFPIKRKPALLIIRPGTKNEKNQPGWGK